MAQDEQLLGTTRDEQKKKKKLAAMCAVSWYAIAMLYVHMHMQNSAGYKMLSPGVGWGRWRQCARQQLCVGCVER